MSNKNSHSAKQRGGTHSTKLLFTAAAITITLGGAVGFLGAQTASPASETAAVADASGITVTYAAPAATATTVPTLTLTPIPTSALAATTEPVTESIATTVATSEPTATAEPTATSEPTAVPTVQPTATAAVARRPVFVARSRSSR